LPDTLKSAILNVKTAEQRSMARKVFTPDDPALPMNYPGFVFRKLREEGYPADKLLAETGLEAKLLSDPHFRCGFQPLRRLLLNAIEQTGDPHLGVKLAREFQPTYIGLPAYTAMNAATCREGLATLERYFFLNFPAFDLKLLESHHGLRDDEVAIRFRSKFPFDELEYFAFSSVMIAINGLLKSMLGMEQVTTRADLTISRPDSWSDIADIVRVPVRFDAGDNQIIFRQDHLDWPLPGADPINHARFVGLCEKFAAEMAFETTLLTQVLAILEGAPTLTMSLSDVAAELGYSERGLRRQLDRSGTSYRKLVDQVRSQRAKDRLLNTVLPIKTIADELGFESASNFGRSFKRWTGKTPRAFRLRASQKS
jgi:AraC-like DNA-binding protein